MHGRSIERPRQLTCNRQRQSLSYCRDDGGDLAYLLHTDCQVFGRDIIGGCEETTTGVQRLRALAAEGQLLYPIVLSMMLVVNIYSTIDLALVESVWTAIMALTSDHCWKNSCCVWVLVCVVVV